MKTLDVKSILVLFFLAISLFFGYKWLYGGNPESRKRVKELEKEFKELEKQKEENAKSILFWKNRFDSLQTEGNRLQEELKLLEKTTQEAEAAAEKSKSSLEKLRKELAETRKKIDRIKKDPPVKSEEALLQSLKNKTK
jgi:chromosome segregation ATPase